MGRVAYLFPGQGSQEVGMGWGFARTCPESRDVFVRADAAVGFQLSALIEYGPADRLALTELTQPAVLAASVAVLYATQRAGVPSPDYVAGHSLGEYSALVAAGVLRLEDAVCAVRERGRFMQEAIPVGEGAMAAIVNLEPDSVARACSEAEAELPGMVVVPANMNGPGQVVIAGHTEAVHLAGERCKASGARRVLPLPVSAPFHSPLMRPVQAKLAEVLAAIRFDDARVPLVTNVEAAPESRGERLRELLIEQVIAPVRWTDVVARLLADGCDTFIEIGPGSVLAGLVRRQAPDARVMSISQPEQLSAASAAFAA